MTFQELLTVCKENGLQVLISYMPEAYAYRLTFIRSILDERFRWVRTINEEELRYAQCDILRQVVAQAVVELSTENCRNKVRNWARMMEEYGLE